MASIASKRVLPLTAPALVSLDQPLYQAMLAMIGHKYWLQMCDQHETHLGDSSNMLSPCHPEMGTKATALGL